jgi:hypothetical protein
MVKQYKFKYWRRFSLTSSIFLSAFIWSSSGHADTGSGRIVVEYAEKAIAKGYGDMCSLEMKPVKVGGYFNCLDFGPYRYVKGYNNVSAYVVQAGKPPYQIMGGSADNPKYLIDGPWVLDMPRRMVGYWNDVVEGRAKLQEEKAAVAARKSAAEDYINSLVDAEKPKIIEAEGQRVKDTVVDQVIKDEVGTPIPSQDLQEALGTLEPTSRP